MSAATFAPKSGGTAEENSSLSSQDRDERLYFCGDNKEEKK